MKLYVDPITVNCRKVQAGFALLGIDYDLVLVDPLHADLPALIDDEMLLWEPNAILQHAAEKKQNSPYYPLDRMTRAEIHRWMIWETSSWFPSCYVLMVEGCVKPILGQPTDQRVLDDQEKNFHRLANTLDVRLAQHPWLCGENMTIADLVVAAPLYLQPYQKLPIDQHVHLKRWLTERMSHLPCWNGTEMRQSPERMLREDLSMLVFNN